MLRLACLYLPTFPCCPYVPALVRHQPVATVMGCPAMFLWPRRKSHVLLLRHNRSNRSPSFGYPVVSIPRVLDRSLTIRHRESRQSHSEIRIGRCWPKWGAQLGLVNRAHRLSLAHPRSHPTPPEWFVARYAVHSDRGRITDDGTTFVLRDPFYFHRGNKILMRAWPVRVDVRREVAHSSSSPLKSSGTSMSGAVLASDSIRGSLVATSQRHGRTSPCTSGSDSKIWIRAAVFAPQNVQPTGAPCTFANRATCNSRSGASATG
jgi:hypothetical protein